MKPSFQILNDEDHQMYINKEKDDAAHAITVHQAPVDQPTDPAFLPKYVLTPTTGEATITERGSESMELMYQKPEDRVDQSGKIYRCQLGECNRTFLTPEIFLRHLTQHRTRCADCLKPFQQWQQLFYHAETCKYRLQRLKGKMNPVPAQPRTKPNVNCRLCGAVCDNPTALQRHHLHLHAQRPASKIWILKR